MAGKCILLRVRSQINLLLLLPSPNQELITCERFFCAGSAISRVGSEDSSSMFFSYLTITHSQSSSFSTVHCRTPHSLNLFRSSANSPLPAFRFTGLTRHS